MKPAYFSKSITVSYIKPEINILILHIRRRYGFFHVGIRIIGPGLGHGQSASPLFIDTGGGSDIAGCPALGPAGISIAAIHQSA
ncbi:MAG: hypothetical protein WC980_10375, partial [Candidatus Brocadiia bacterium]